MCSHVLEPELAGGAETFQKLVPEKKQLISAQLLGN
jgi:hypothetical protein